MGGCLAGLFHSAGGGGGGLDAPRVLGKSPVFRGMLRASPGWGARGWKKKGSGLTGRETEV